MSRSNRTPEHSSPSHVRHHRQNRHRAKKLDLQNEGLRNARKTVTIVAVLVATVTFAAGINPPGGFSQETGKALRGDRAAFKVFLVCNIVALFLSVGVVNVLVSIIPFTRKTMMKLLTATHKVMWLSTLFMTAAYIAAVWTIMPDEKGTRWVTLELVVFGGGCTVFVFFGLGLMLTRHWYNKYKWRKVRQKKIKDESPHSSVSRVEELKMRINQETSSNSDVDSSDHGYHLKRGRGSREWRWQQRRRLGGGRGGKGVSLERVAATVWTWEGGVAKALVLLGGGGGGNGYEGTGWGPRVAATAWGRGRGCGGWGLGEGSGNVGLGRVPTALAIFLL
ncbi:Ankyrin repeat-containing protein NPR4 [Sesamum alatum]|uniref:Ankyrin repeat-containing protein NPR4 n=1 Tax=Sesamum alatum TaxID=300844 RepID=A0AAE1XXK3_9LAMI|nr:Ankyrin repeat-containing protein NPR4 [Sesamum alatum]